MKSFKNFVTENISQEDIKRIRRMMTADPVKARRLQVVLESTRQSAERISGGKTRTSQTGRRTRTRPSARNTPAGRAADAEFFKKLEIGTEKGAAAENQAAQDMKAEFERKRPTSSKSKTSSGLADLNREIDKVKPKVTTRRGRLSSQVDDVLKGLRRQAGLEKRMSAGYDRTLVRRGEEALKQIRADSKPLTTSQLIKQTQQKPPTAPKPPTVTKPTLPTFASKGKTALPGVEKVKPGSRTLRGSAAQVNKPPAITKADVVRQSNTAVADAAKQARVSGASKLKGFLRGAGYVGAGLEAAGEYKRRKDMGQDTATAAAGSGTRAVGGAAGAKLAAGLAAKTLSPLALAPFPGARPLYALGVGAAGIAGYTGGADAATKGFDYVKKNFKGFQDKANKAYQRLLLPQYRTKTEEFVPEEAEFTVEFVQRLKDFSRPVTNNPVVKAVTNNPATRLVGKGLNVLDKLVLGAARTDGVLGLVDPEARPSQKAIRAVTTFAPPGIAHVSAALTPSIDNSKFIRKNIDEPIMRTNKKIDKAVGQHPKPGSGKPPNYARLYRDMQTRGMSMF